MNRKNSVYGSPITTRNTLPPLRGSILIQVTTEVSICDIQQWVTTCLSKYVASGRGGGGADPVPERGRGSATRRLLRTLRRRTAQGSATVRAVRKLGPRQIRSIEIKSRNDENGRAPFSSIPSSSTFSPVSLPMRNVGVPLTPSSCAWEARESM